MKYIIDGSLSTPARHVIGMPGSSFSYCLGQVTRSRLR
jgi:hypothetical protein